MDFKDFIIGEKYNISALAIEGSFAEKKYAVFKLPTGRTFLLRAEDFEAVSPANGTPVAELEPYIISEGAGIIELYNEKLDVVKAWFYNDVKAGVKALALAEAERDRLNAEHRKEQQ